MSGRSFTCADWARRMDWHQERIRRGEDLARVPKYLRAKLREVECQARNLERARGDEMARSRRYRAQLSSHDLRRWL